MNLARTRIVLIGALSAVLLAGCGKSNFDFDTLLIWGVATAVLAFIAGLWSIALAGLIGAAGGAFIAYTLDAHMLAQYFIGVGAGGLLGLFFGAIAKSSRTGGSGTSALDDVADAVTDFDD